ncbi:hypothetical protein UFOVP49_31 [uncultured Caudovirales phage]|uniref:Uncharacterized protein n=1 Tax=uncultured Caudovirales phage TaxID=2100421 RepID=A0A6J5KPB7_9CAUD|nr:hypothetical protein UFOVP49_31 [uncultured Caudovirales phage]
MSNLDIKDKHSVRLHQKKRHIKRQASIARSFGLSVPEEHRFAKRNATNCDIGPNKRERTIQEKKVEEFMESSYE